LQVAERPVAVHFANRLLQLRRADVIARQLEQVEVDPERRFVTAKDFHVGNVRLGDQRSANIVLCQQADLLVTIEATPKGGNILVSERGPGLGADKIKQVFEPFYRVESSRNRETGGTGLGLPIARQIARAHGGEVALRNRVQGGLEACIHLPDGKSA
jgi:light-regulated signal transduction histidine kinase (bacteriophytochrome)